MTTAPRRLATEAKIVLEKAGYFVSNDGESLDITDHCHVWFIDITSSTVDNAEVERLLEAVKR